MGIGDLTPEAKRISATLASATQKAARLVNLSAQYDNLLLGMEDSGSVGMKMTVGLPAGTFDMGITRRKEEIYTLLLEDLQNQIIDLRREIASLGEQMINGE